MNNKRPNRTPNNLKRVQFYSIFEETLPNTDSIWQPILQDNLPESQLTLISGRMLLKNENDQWEPFLFELQPDRILRHKDVPDQVYLRGCFLKKFNNYDQQYPSHKYGFRLQMGQQLAFFMTDQMDQFKKWFWMLKRFCILEKFTRKYKVIAQLKYNDPIFYQVCYNCVRLSDAGYYLVKIIPKDITQQQKNVMFKELQNLRRLNQPQLMRLIEVYEDENHVYQVFDQYMGGDLRQHLKETQQAQELGVQIDEKLLADMMYGLLSALAHMHSKGIFHRDIKLDNLFVPENKRLPFVLLTNFCYSESFRFTGTDARERPQGYKKCGTPGYVAPEIFKTKFYDSKIDVFSLGVVFYILVYGKMPFEGGDQEEILKANERCEIDFSAEKRLCKSISQSGIELMKKMLAKDPNGRISSNSGINHTWFIKMKSNSQRRANPIQQQRSLSTIFERSELMELTQSYIPAYRDGNYKNMPSKKNVNTPGKPQQNSKSQFETANNDQEFVTQNLDAKMQYINQQLFSKLPSKKRHDK